LEVAKAFLIGNSILIKISIIISSLEKGCTLGIHIAENLNYYSWSRRNEVDSIWTGSVSYVYFSAILVADAFHGGVLHVLSIAASGNANPQGSSVSPTVVWASRHA